MMTAKAKRDMKVVVDSRRTESTQVRFIREASSKVAEWPDVNICEADLSIILMTKIISNPRDLRENVDQAKSGLEKILDRINRWAWTEEYWPYASPLEGVILTGVASLTNHRRCEWWMG